MTTPLSQLDVKALAALPQRGAAEKEALRRVLREKMLRSKEALRLYRPMPTQELVHRSAASERIVRGGNQSGKTSAVAAEVASAATGIPIIGGDGNPVPFRYPTNRPLKIWIIGYDEKHIGQTLHRMLFTNDNGLQIIKDQKTGLYRSYCPWDPADKAREHECEPMPPFIPQRFLKKDSFAWKDARANVFTCCTLKNGTEIYAYSSKADPKQGDQVDLIWIDEDIEWPKHVAEWQARLSKRRGRLIWSSFPRSSNDALFAMSERAKEQRDRPDPDVFEIVLKFSDNPFMDDNEKRKRLESWSEAERIARDTGEFLTHTISMYPNFNRHVHCTPHDRKDKLDEFLEQNNWKIPDDWTHYLVLDPGHAKPAVLLAAVPPEELGDFVVCYGEVFVPRTDAFQTARFTAEKIRGKYFHTFLIDSHAGRQTPGGFNKTIGQQYADAFRHEGLRSTESGSSFIPASDNVEAGIGLVREWLAIRKNGTAKLKILTAFCPNLIRQLESYRKHVVQDEAKDKPAPNQKDDLCDCLRYLAAYEPRWVPPEQQIVAASPAYRGFQEWQAGNKKDEYVLMGVA